MNPLFSLNLYSGYTEEQTKKILKNGIKGYIGRMRSREKLGKKLRSTAEESRKSRYLGKLLSKTGWYRKKRKTTEKLEPGKRSRGEVQGSVASCSHLGATNSNPQHQHANSTFPT